MQTKRQTVWLVTMLSLMVVLSGYYLFTADSPATMLTSGTSDTLEDTSAADEDVLDELDEGNAVSVFNQLESERDQYVEEANASLLATIATDSDDDQAMAEAVAKLESLENKSVAIATLESELKKQYPSVVIVPQANDHVKVTVQSKELDRKQADLLMLTVIDKLDVQPTQVSIQFLP